MPDSRTWVRRLPGTGTVFLSKGKFGMVNRMGARVRACERALVRARGKEL